MTEGTFYKFIIDPLLSGLRKDTAKMIPENLQIIDVACGTGALAFELSKKAQHVTGIDASESMVKTANISKTKFGISNLTFKVANATELHQFKKNEFDIATISLAIHQFDTETGLLIINELNRISKKILIIDYACPLPNNLYRNLIFFIEKLAGREHFKNFKTYQEYGGIQAYLNQHKLASIITSEKGKSIFSMVLCK